jgi:PKD repeat protein
VNSKTISKRRVLRHAVALVLSQAMLLMSLPLHAFSDAGIEPSRGRSLSTDSYGTRVVEEPTLPGEAAVRETASPDEIEAASNQGPRSFKRVSGARTHAATSQALHSSRELAVPQFASAPSVVRATAGSLMKPVGMRSTTVTPPSEAIAVGAVVRHAPSINSARVKGSVRQLTGENLLLNGGAVITGDLLVPGTPQLTLNGNPTFGGTVQAGGSTQPTNYRVTLNGNVQLGRLVTRTDPVALPGVTSPPASTGTRSVTLNREGQDPGDFRTLRDLTLNSNAGIVAVPPGTYRNFIANGGTGFTLGVAGSTQASIYNLASLILNGKSELRVVGPVMLTVGSGLTVNASMGKVSNPLWLTLKVAAGGVILNGGSSLNGVVIAPSSTVIINGNSTLKGSVFCDRLTVNGGGVLQAIGDSSSPVIVINSPACENAVTNLAQLGVSGTVLDSNPTTVEVNGAAAIQSAGTFSATVPLNEGPNTLTAVATDLFNNSAQATRNVIRRTGPNQAPVVTAGPDLVVILPGAAGLNGAVSDEGLPTCAALATGWSKVSGPGAVLFSSPNTPSTTASFSAPGVYLLRLSSSDTELTGIDEVTVTVYPPNQPPVVSAGANQTIELPAAAALNGTVQDDGLPPGSTLAHAWSKVSGPGTVSFSPPNQAQTTASFGVAGTYVLQFSVNDTQYAATSTTTVTVIPENQPPVVNAGADQTIELPNSVTLNGTATDDGLPQGSPLTIAWSKVSGPGTVTFGTPNQAETTATFTVAGTYVVQLSGNDTRFTITSNVTVTVIPENAAPVVSAGPDQTIELPANTVTLNGTVNDDGLPPGSSLTIAWSKVSGPGIVTFGTPNQAVTTASFTVAGTYVLQLSANDTRFTITSNVTVTVIPENTAPVVNAGPNQTIQLPTNTVTLNGTATDDGLPPGSTLTVNWSKVSGPGTVTFGDATQAVTTATFSEAGVYVLRLSANDTRLTTTSDATITVQPGGPAPVAAFNVPGVSLRLFATVAASSPSISSRLPGVLLDFNDATFWQPQQAANQFVTVQFTGGEQFIDRVQLQSRNGSIINDTVKNFDVLVSQTANDADFVPVLSGTYQNTGDLQEFVFPAGAVRARFAKLIARDNYGAATMTLGTFNVVTVGTHDSVVTLTAPNNVALAESPSMLMNGARIVASSDAPGGTSPNTMLTFNNSSDGWQTSSLEDHFAIIELAGGKVYTLRGIRIGLSVRDFEVSVSTTTTDATAFTQVLSAAHNSSVPIETFLFPGGPVQARYVKYVPRSAASGTTVGTGFFDVIADEVGGVAGFSSFANSVSVADRAIDNDTGTNWSSASNQTTNQSIKVLLTGARVHRLYGVRIQPRVASGTSAPRDFDIRVSTTTADDAAFTTVFSGTALNTNNAQTFTFSAPVDAKYVEFFFKQNYGTSFMSVTSLEALEEAQDGAVLRSVTSQAGATTAAAFSLDIDTTNGPWMSASGQNSNQSLLIMTAGSDPWTVDRVILQPGRNPSNSDVSVGVRNFDILVSTTDMADASFTTVFSGTLQNIQNLQEFRFAPVEARFIKLLLKDNFGNASQIALNSFYAVSPEMGSTDARFVDRSTVSTGSIVSWAWEFGDGGSSSDRDPSHVYAQPGLYAVKLTVTTNTGQVGTTQIIYNALAPLAADFVFSPLDPTVGDQITFTDMSSPRLGRIVERSWDTGASGFFTGLSISRSYTEAGIYQVKLTVGDPEQAHYSATRAVEVFSLPTTAGNIQGATSVLGQTWAPGGPSVSDRSSDNAGSLRCNWAFGGGKDTEITRCIATSKRSRAAPASTHIYASPGLFLARLSVFDESGRSARAVALKVVSRRPTAFNGLFAQTEAARSR